MAVLVDQTRGYTAQCRIYAKSHSKQTGNIRTVRELVQRSIIHLASLIGRYSPCKVFPFALTSNIRRPSPVSNTILMPVLLDGVDRPVVSPGASVLAAISLCFPRCLES